MKLNLSPAPHVHSSQSTRTLMLHVIIALIPCAAFGVWSFGVNALTLMLVSVLSAVLFEFLWQKLTKSPVRIGDLSAVVTGLILALNLPSGAPWWLAVVGSAFAIVIVKGLFGGLGDNFINPALAARAVLLTSWPSHMTKAFLPMRTLLESAAEKGVDTLSSATPLLVPGMTEVKDLLLGNIPGAIGETCKIAILIGLVYLLVRKVISWEIPVIMVGTVALCSWAFGADPLKAILSGGLLFGACFMATDYVTSPMLKLGHVIYAVGCGLMVALIRQFGNYPEGVTYAILLMNIVTPLLDRALKRKVYGEVKQHG